MRRTALLPFLLGLALAAGLPLHTARAAEPALPLFDAHLHYNWEPVPHFPLEKVLALFRAHGIMGVLATSRPNDGTRALYEAKPRDVWVVPFIRPYRVRPDIQTWMRDPQTEALIAAEYQRGYYQGIGEFHLTGRAAEAPQVGHTVAFAAQHDLYLHAHADDEALEILFRHNPQAKIVWAHTGFSTAPDKVEAYLQRYPTLWCELSYRYGITDGGGRLTPEWRRLFERYPERFLVGSDTWIDERWDDYGSLMAGYRSWLAQLPREVAERIAYRNGERLFRR
ncbi:MAG: amidohydrolase family protein [Rhodocyclales bacterium]|nr:amidohydrolase family protein [Rhodocyclales bacterium]